MTTVKPVSLRDPHNEVMLKEPQAHRSSWLRGAGGLRQQQWLTSLLPRGALAHGSSSVRAEPNLSNEGMNMIFNGGGSFINP